MHNSESDIDALCVVPKHVERGSFFHQNLYDKFKDKEHSQFKVSEFNPLPSATVPVIKMKINEVEIDLLFVQ